MKNSGSHCETERLGNYANSGGGIGPADPADAIPIFPAYKHTERSSDLSTLKCPK